MVRLRRAVALLIFFASFSAIAATSPQSADPARDGNRDHPKAREQWFRQGRTITDDQPPLAVGAIAIKPDDPKVILVGTGESDSSADSYYGLGIMRSTDGGATWSLITQTAHAINTFRGLGFAKISFSNDSS